MTPDEQLVEALHLNNLVSARHELEAGTDPDTRIDGYPLLCTAASQASPAAVKPLLQYAPHPQSGDSHGRMTPVLFAAISGREAAPEVLRILGGAGAEINETTPEGTTVLDMAVRIGHIPSIVAIRLLRDRGSHASQAVAERFADRYQVR